VSSVTGDTRGDDTGSKGVLVTDRGDAFRGRWGRSDASRRSCPHVTAEREAQRDEVNTPVRGAGFASIGSLAVKIRELEVPDAYAVTTTQHRDDRGAFLEWYRFEPLEEAVGHPLRLAQANCSVSRRGTVRGIHYADVPPSQAKYVTCVRGAVLDVVIDIRVGSPAFGRYDAVRLDDDERAAVYLAEGLGHAFVALTDDATVVYLCNEVYSPTREHGITPADPDLAVDWPRDVPLLLSPKDEAAPTLAAAREAGALPDYAACREYYESLRTSGR
jgi:dTDP-4-dehydrorhamnose 3,5-epimerase